VWKNKEDIKSFRTLNVYMRETEHIKMPSHLFYVLCSVTAEINSNS